MPHKHNANRRHHIPKMSFKVENWPEYERGCDIRTSLMLHGVQTAVAADRGPAYINPRVDGPDDIGTGSYHGQPSGGDVAGDQSGAGAARFDAHVLIDSTGLQVYGAGQWLETKHGAKARRKWRKRRLAVDAASGMIVARTLTYQDTDDPSRVAPLLDQIDGQITRVTADGAYDGTPTYQAIAAHGMASRW
jgi:hypothetical protein